MSELSHLIAYAATEIEATPRYHGTNEVQRRGDKLSPVMWLGSQWAVTCYGIEARDGTYGIAKHRLWENEGPYGWLLHMAEKDWADLDDFAEALRLARRLH